MRPLALILAGLLAAACSEPVLPVSWEVSAESVDCPGADDQHGSVSVASGVVSAHALACRWRCGVYLGTGPREVVATFEQPAGGAWRLVDVAIFGANCG